MEAVPHEGNGSEEELASATLAEGKHFVSALSAVAGRQALHAHEDIYSRQGVKLVTRGAALTDKVTAHLLQHKLLKPVERSLTLEGALTAAELAQHVAGLIGETVFLAPLAADKRALAELQGIFSGLELPAALAFKLSVAASERPGLFRHSLLVATLATALGRQMRLAGEDLRLLALAGILHDIGELHIDPAILVPGHMMSHEERRHLYAHPITGFMLLCQHAEIPHAAALAVLQHQERLDGSGYPYRLRDKDIGRLTRYVALADVAASVLERTESAACLNALLSLNRQKYDVLLVNALRRLYGDWGGFGGGEVDEVALMTRLIQVGNLFDAWDDLQSAMTGTDPDGPLAFLALRMDALRVAMAQAGFDQTSHESLLALTVEDDPAIRGELGILFAELEWQLKAVSREIERVLYAERNDVPPPLRPLFTSWLQALHEFVGEN